MDHALRLTELQIQSGGKTVRILPLINGITESRLYERYMKGMEGITESRVTYCSILRMCVSTAPQRKQRLEGEKQRLGVEKIISTLEHEVVGRYPF